MIADKAKEAIGQAIAYELQNIVKEHGAVYNSGHEGYAILKEEYEEALDCLHGLNDKIGVIWAGLKVNIVGRTAIYEAQKYAKALAEEAVQCAAVCEKYLETFGGINGDKK